jgi:hypothetical protein
MNQAIRELVEILARAAFEELRQAPPPPPEQDQLIEHRPAA